MTYLDRLHKDMIDVVCKQLRIRNTLLYTVHTSPITLSLGKLLRIIEQLIMPLNGLSVLSVPVLFHTPIYIAIKKAFPVTRRLRLPAGRRQEPLEHPKNVSLLCK